MVLTKKVIIIQKYIDNVTHWVPPVYFHFYDFLPVHYRIHYRWVYFLRSYNHYIEISERYIWSIRWKKMNVEKNIRNMGRATIAQYLVLFFRFVI